MILRFDPEGGYAEPAALAMHVANGLLVEAMESRFVEDEVQGLLVQELIAGKFAGRPMAGNAVCFDRRILEARMPLLASFWSHRQFDVRALLPLLGYPELRSPHRALADVLHDIALARRALGWPQ